MSNKRSKKQESEIASLVHSKEVTASGAFWNAKGDVRTEDCLIEVKYTDKDYYTLSLNTWNKIRKEAIRDKGRIPLMFVDIKKERMVIFSYHDFLNKEIRFDIALDSVKSIRLYPVKYDGEVFFKLGHFILGFMSYDQFVTKYKEELSWVA